MTNLGKYSKIFSFISQIITSSVSILLIPVYIRLIGIESYGIIGIFSIFQSWLALCDLGLSNLITRMIAGFKEINHDIQEKINLSFLVYLLATCFIAIVIVFLTKIYIGSQIIEEGHTNIFIISICVSLITSIRLYEVLFSGIYVSIGRRDSINVLTLITTILRSFGLIIVLMYISKTLLAFFIWNLLISLVNLFYLVKNSKNFLLIDYKIPTKIFSKLIELLKLSKNYLIFSLLSITLMQSSKLILSGMVSVRDFGYYYFSSNMANVLLILLPPLAQIFYPKFCQYLVRDNFKDLKNSLHLSSQFVSVFFGTVSASLFFFIGPILSMWTGNQVLVENSTDIIKILIIGNLFSALTFIPYQLQLAEDNFYIMVIISLISNILSIPLTLILVNKYSATGAALSWVLLNAFQLIFCAKFMVSKRIRFRLKNWYLYDTFIPIIIIFSLNYLMYFIFPDNNTDLFLVLYILLCLIISVLVALIFTKNLRNQFLLIIQRDFLHN